MKELNNISGMGRSGSLVKTSSTLAVVLMMMMAAATMPAVACDCGTKEKVEGNGVADDFIIENEHGFGNLKVLMSVVSDKDTISVIKDLRSKGYELQYDKTNIQRIRPKENISHEALLVIIHAESKNGTNSAQVVFTSNGERTCVANAIIEDGANYRKIGVYEIDNGTEKNYVVENRAGTISIDGKTIITGSQQIRSGQIRSNSCGTDGCHWESSRNYRICRSVCGYICVAGCGLSGYIVCLAACAGVAGPACPVICVVVYALLCTYGSNHNCATICSRYR